MTKHITKPENKTAQPKRTFFYTSTGVNGSTGSKMFKKMLTKETVAPQRPPPKLNSLISAGPMDDAIPAPFP